MVFFSALTNRLHRAKLYGQKIIVDCSYENCMTHQEWSNVAKGLKRVYAENRNHKMPFDLHLCGVKPNSVIIKNLCGQIPSLVKMGSPTEIHSECFMQLFPKKQLVMLTPDSANVLEYNSNDIYIVGGIVDYGRSDPLTLAKAKELGIRTARLPLDNLRLQEGDSRELPMSAAIAVVREFQINKNINDILNKCVYLHSKKKIRNDVNEAEK